MRRRYSPGMYPMQPQQYSGASPFISEYSPTLSPEYKQLMYEGMQRKGERYDQAVQGISQQIAQFGEIETQDPDTIGSRLTDYQKELDDIVKDYNYDYSRAKTSLVKKMAKEAANPLWSYNKEHVRNARLAEQMELQWGAQNTLWANDPRKHSLQEIMENPELAQTKAFQAPDYIEVIKDTVGKIPASTISEYLNTVQAGELFKYGTVTGVDIDDLERIAEAIVEPFKDRTRVREYDNRPGSEWLHDDESIKEMIMQTLNPQLHLQYQSRYRDTPQRGGIQGGNTPIWVPPSAAQVIGNQTAQGVTSSIKSIKDLKKARESTDPTSAANAEELYEELYKEVIAENPGLAPLSQLFENPKFTGLLMKVGTFVQERYGIDPQRVQSDLQKMFLNKDNKKASRQIREYLFTLEEQKLEEYWDNNPEDSKAKKAKKLKEAGKEQEYNNFLRNEVAQFAKQIRYRDTEENKIFNEAPRELEKQINKAFGNIDDVIDRKIKEHKTDFPIYTPATNEMGERATKSIFTNLSNLVTNFGIDGGNEQLKVFGGNEDILATLGDSNAVNEYSLTIKSGSSKTDPQIGIVSRNNPETGVVLELAGSLQDRLRNMYNIASNLNEHDLFYGFINNEVSKKLAPYEEDESKRKEGAAYVLPVAAIYGGESLYRYGLIKKDGQYEVRAQDSEGKYTQKVLLGDSGESLSTTDPNKIGQLLDLLAMSVGGMEDGFLRASAYKNAQDNMSKGQIQKAFKTQVEKFNSLYPSQEY